MRSRRLIARLRVLLGVLLLATSLVLGGWVTAMHVHLSGLAQISGLAHAHATMTMADDHASQQDVLVQQICKRSCTLATGLLPDADVLASQAPRTHPPEPVSRIGGLSPVPTGPPPKSSLG